MPLGEERENSRYTNEQIKLICKLISEGKSNTEIMKITGFPKHSIFKLIQNIKNGHCWKHISCNYDFSNAKNKNVFRDGQIHKICEYFQNNGTNCLYKNVLDYIGIDYSNISEKELDCLNAAICNLRTKKSFKQICNQYNYNHIPKNKICSTTIENY